VLDDGGRDSYVPRDPRPLLDRRAPFLPRPSRLVAAVAVVLAVGVVGFGAYLLGRDEPRPTSYDSVEELAAAIRAGSGECRRLGRSLSSPPQPGHEIGICRIGSVTSTLQVYDDPSMVRSATAEPRLTWITLVIGPNWVVATDRTGARLVSRVTGGLVLAP
jgi:hypothetical protein